MSTYATTAYQRGRDARRYAFGHEDCREIGNPAREEWLRGYNDMDHEMGRRPDVSAPELADFAFAMLVAIGFIGGIYLFVAAFTGGHQ